MYANVGGLGLGFVTGSPVALIPNPRDLADVLKTIHSVKPAFMMGVPTLFQAMLNNPDVQKGRIDFSSIKVSFSGAAALMAATKQQFESLTGGRIIEGYSLTEGMMACLVNPMKGQAKIGSIGLPLPDVEARIVETEHGLAERAPREEGELVLSAPQLMKGYWRNAEESAQSPPARRRWPRVAAHRRHRLHGRRRLRLPHRSQEGPDQDQRLPGVAARGRGSAVRSTRRLPRSGSRAYPIHSAAKRSRRGSCFARASRRPTRSCESSAARQLAPFKVPQAIEFRTELPKSLIGKILRRELVRQHVSAA